MQHYQPRGHKAIVSDGTLMGFLLVLSILEITNSFVVQSQTLFPAEQRHILAPSAEIVARTSLIVPAGQRPARSMPETGLPRPATIPDESPSVRQTPEPASLERGHLLPVFRPGRAF